ncbi:MAG TPA: MsnO8 family LLM class oxidoreductase [Caulobacter sp.]|nr:MsnO8 family LLM class oxidoreductase [Caulobacter sp.]
MTLPLSILDLSTIQAGSTPAEAIRRSVDLACAADALGYRRYWLAEHHSTASHAGTAPEILIAALTQATSRIRLGSGGVLLANYSPLKVAEQFMTLEALAPGRIDLGVGRAVGGDERTAQALRSAGLQAFPSFFPLLQAFLLDAGGRQPFPIGHPLKGVRAQPWGPGHPELFVLCSSARSAAIAGQLGVGMVYAEFLSGTGSAEAIEAYRAAFRPSLFRRTPHAATAIAAFAADTTEEARRLDSPRRAWVVGEAEGLHEAFPTLEAAEARLADRAGHPSIARAEARSLVGDGPTVRAGLAAKLADTGADEIFVIAAGPTLADQVRSLELMIGS